MRNIQKKIWILSILPVFMMMGCTENTKTVEDTKKIVVEEVKEKVEEGKKKLEP